MSYDFDVINKLNPSSDVCEHCSVANVLGMYVLILVAFSNFEQWVNFFPHFSSPCQSKCFTWCSVFTDYNHPCQPLSNAREACAYTLDWTISPELAEQGDRVRSGDGRSWTVQLVNLRPYTEYTFQVNARNRKGTSTPSVTTFKTKEARKLMITIAGHARCLMHTAICQIVIIFIFIF